ncbi:hypothetical protein TNIN_245631 [Trichonephila inaurata madagascariensis]|uniref:Uncharacterized protein n=1 Tax=Trichonephila inaurata madagascariensis TaxID=2747483 RepID=A0A8X7C044_9ARAC|nr:hypothetical protein TNIN_245631 [Trichonephila inaurata madagascariensis]
MVVEGLRKYNDVIKVAEAHWPLEVSEIVAMQSGQSVLLLQNNSVPIASLQFLKPQESPHLKRTMGLCYLDDIIVFSESFDDHPSKLTEHTKMHPRCRSCSKS